jgi:membrane protein implicated in regulation of membrane protease activity
MSDDSLEGWTWFTLAVAFFALEARWSGKFMMWFGLAAMLVGIIASVVRWPWPLEAGAFVVFALAAVPYWRQYERSTSR